jgi:hypothetical protein
VRGEKRAGSTVSRVGSSFAVGETRDSLLVLCKSDLAASSAPHLPPTKHMGRQGASSLVGPQHPAAVCNSYTSSLRRCACTPNKSSELAAFD